MLEVPNKPWAQLDDPWPSYSKNKFIGIWLSNLPFATQFVDLKKFTSKARVVPFSHDRVQFTILSFKMDLSSVHIPCF